MTSKSNSQEMGDASATMEAIGKSLDKRGLTSAPIDQCLKWVKEDLKPPETSWMQEFSDFVKRNVS